MVGRTRVAIQALAVASILCVQAMGARAQGDTPAANDRTPAPTTSPPPVPSGTGESGAASTAGTADMDGGNGLRAIVDKLAQAIDGDPGIVRPILSSTYMVNNSWMRTRKRIKDLHARYGRIVSVKEVDRRTPEIGLFRITFAKDAVIPVTITVAGNPPRIIGLRIGTPLPARDDWGKVCKDFRALPGSVSLCAMALGPGSHILGALEPERPMAIGSVSKLYVLGALVAQLKSGQAHWTDVMALTEASRSHAVGILQAWPTGAPVTLYTLAALMISLSDNTAMDHLIARIGRTKIEEALATMGHRHADRCIPFLTSREEFILKSDAGESIAQGFAKLGPADRRAQLAMLAGKDITQVSGWDEPRYVDSIEWFASCADLCRALDWILEETQDGDAAKARDLLAIEGRTQSRGSHWAFVGYKGGSEPGVVCDAYLVRSRKGSWFAVAVAWNNSARSLGRGRYAVLLTRSLHLLEQQE